MNNTGIIDLVDRVDTTKSKQTAHFLGQKELYEEPCFSPFIAERKDELETN